MHYSKFIKNHVIEDLENASRALSRESGFFISAFEVNEIIISRLQNVISKKGVGFENLSVCSIILGQKNKSPDLKSALGFIVSKLGLNDYKYYSGAVMYPVMAPGDFCFKKVIMDESERAREIYIYTTNNGLSFWDGGYGLMRIEFAKFVVDRLVSLRGSFN